MFARLILVAAVLAALTTLSPARLLAEDKNPMKHEPVETILAKCAEATGGKAAYDQLRNRVIKGKVEIGSYQLDISVTRYESVPGRMRQVMDVERVGTIEQGTDGTVAWQTHPTRGPRVLTGGDKDFMINHANLSWDVFSSVRFVRTVYIGTEEVEGKSCHKLIRVPREGDLETWYIDKASHLVAKTEVIIPTTGLGKTVIVTAPSDYRPIDGILFPHRILAWTGERQEVFTIESIQHNVDMPDDRFALPAEIKALLEADS